MNVVARDEALAAVDEDNWRSECSVPSLGRGVAGRECDETEACSGAASSGDCLDMMDEAPQGEALQGEMLLDEASQVHSTPPEAILEESCGGAPHGRAAREKFVFLVRHAESTWNRDVDKVKTLGSWMLQDISLSDLLSSTFDLAWEVWNTDHPISDEGLRQTGELRRKVADAAAQRWPHRVRQGESELARTQRYYEMFVARRPCIYCSPLLRALQTAHLALPQEDGWGGITLLRDAREWFRHVVQRDCVGREVGEHIVERAMQAGQELTDLDGRVDFADCVERWWSDGPEAEPEVEERLLSLWQRLLDGDDNDSCVLVTHSNLIRALLRRFGGPAIATETMERECDLGSHGKLSDAVDDEPKQQQADEVVEDEDVEDCGDISTTEWTVVGGGLETLHRVKDRRLQNCGVLGLRCVLEPSPRTSCAEAVHPPGMELQWRAKDALLMFGTVLVR